LANAGRGGHKTPPRRRAEVWLAVTGLAVLLFSGAVIGIAYLQAQAPDEPVAMVGDDPVAALSRRLRESEFHMLDLTTRGNGQVVLRGRLATEAQRDKLAQWLQDAPLMPTLELVVDESLVREVTEVFRVNGIAVSAQAIGPGQVAAEAAERDAAALARAEESVRRDVRGLLSLNVRNALKPVAPPAPPVNDDPGKRIASLVAGTSAYLVTVDGARYFVGAILPTGHRIVAIEKTAVALERDGHKTSLKF
jgi:type III secretion protein D